MKLPAFVPASEPSYYLAGGGLVLKAEYSRTITVTCEVCKHTQLPLKLLSDTPLSQRACDRLLTEHLDGAGWTRLREGGADICPMCSHIQNVDICPHCRKYDGGHMSHCPTLFPGFSG